jgi:hypothetical protein
MAEPLHAVGGWQTWADHESVRGDAATRPSLPRRVRRALAARARLSWALITRPARLLPGLSAIGCAVAGTWLLWGLGWALLVAVPFLLLLDARTPRG